MGSFEFSLWFFFLKFPKYIWAFLTVIIKSVDQTRRLGIMKQSTVFQQNEQLGCISVFRCLAK